MTISLCMIVRDEEDVLARCLDSVHTAMDEIIIVDTGSTDATKEIARHYTDKVYDFAWIDDFAAARNASFSYATMDYQMWLDADDVVPPEELLKLLALKEILDPSTNVVTMLYHTAFDQQGEPVFISRRERLLRRDKHFIWMDPVHEYILMHGNVRDTDIIIEHHKQKAGDPGRNLRIYQALEASGRALSARQIYYYARECMDHQLYAEAIERFKSFLAQGQGWSEDNIAACYCLSQCHLALGDKDLATDALIRAFRYGGPRAEIACQLGYLCWDRGESFAAEEWFRAAVSAKHPDNGGFILKDYWGFVPCLELCVLCYEKGDLKSAYAFNEMAAKYKPNANEVLQNRKYLEEKGVFSWSK